ncbi:MAG: hypothetical protein OEU92_15425 [Alphaproteobacteria bacterium]|nr:hypothetical protein [Alphaproteobacteria bacterium]
MNDIFKTISRVLLRTVVIAVSMPAALSIEDAVAQSICSDINILIEEAPRDFSGIIVEPSRGSGGYGVTFELEGASDCTVRQLLKGKSYYCTWEFRHRDAEAYMTYKALGQDLQSCIGDRAVLSDDQNVNHPDFYESRMFLLDQAKVSVSVKDKSALGSTFIFVSVEPLTGT